MSNRTLYFSPPTVTQPPIPATQISAENTGEKLTQASVGNTGKYRKTHYAFGCYDIIIVMEIHTTTY